MGAGYGAPVSRAFPVCYGGVSVLTVVLVTRRVIAHHAAAPYRGDRAASTLLGGAGGRVVDEAIADVAYRLDVGLVALDLGANAADVNIDGA